MATIKFYLNSKKDAEPIIYVSLSFGRQFRHRESTTFRIPREHWNDKKCRLNITRYHVGAKVNNALDIIEKELSEYIVKVSTYTEQLSVVKVKQIIATVVNKSSRIEGFIAFAERYIDDNRKDWSNSKIRLYLAMLKLISEYCDFMKLNLSFQDINIDFFNSLKSHAFAIGLSQNTLVAYMAAFKKVLGHAYLSGVIKTNPSRYFEVEKIVADRALLTEQEVESIAQVVCTTKKMAYVKDLAILEADTALRISDISRLNVRDNLVFKNGRWFIEILPQKTKNTKKKAHKAFVPLTDRAYKILENRRILKPLINITYKRHIEEICKLAGITEEISVIKNIGGKNVEVRAPKYEFIRSHTFRHYAITRMLGLKIPPHVIAGMIGINANTVATYAHLDSSDYADMAIGYGF